MHLCEIEALAVGQDGSGPGPFAEGQLPGAASNSQSRPRAVSRCRQLLSRKAVVPHRALVVRLLPYPRGSNSVN